MQSAILWDIFRFLESDIYGNSTDWRRAETPRGCFLYSTHTSKTIQVSDSYMDLDCLETDSTEFSLPGARPSNELVKRFLMLVYPTGGWIK